MSKATKERLQFAIVEDKHRLEVLEAALAEIESLQNENTKAREIMANLVEHGSCRNCLDRVAKLFGMKPGLPGPKVIQGEHHD
jgi:uncharacterized protein YfkK (UPF0435 family)